MLMSFQNRLNGLIAGLVLLLGAQAAGAQIRTVLVSPVPGNPVASGTALRNALTGIPAPSSTDRWLLKIEPGIYDIGTVSLAMRSWVDIEGSGIGVTTVRGTVNAGVNFDGTINGADNAELRLLSVEATGTGASSAAIAVANTNASPRLYRVKLTATAGSPWGLRAFSGSPLIEECEITSTGVTTASGFAYGVSFKGAAPAGRSSILRSKITVSGAGTNYGISMLYAQILTLLRDTRIDVVGGGLTYGIYVGGPWVGGHESLQIRDSEISSAGGATTSYGAFFDSGTFVDLDINGSKVWGHVAPTTYGILQLGSPGAVGIGLQGSSIVGATKTIDASGNISAASTYLNGGPIVSGAWLGCMGVWDENGVFYANSCPP
jgi:hypothetical protein